MQEASPDIASSTDEYAARFSGPVGEYLLRTQEQAVVEMLKQGPQSGRVLEVGGGHCQLTRLLLERGYEVVLHGSSEQAFERAQKLGLTAHPKLTTAVSPLDKLPFSDREFNIVIAIRMLAHIEEWPGFIAELCRVADSEVIIDYASLYTLNILTPLLFQLKKRIEKNTRTYLCQTSGKVIREFNIAGFKTVISRPQFFFPMGLHRLLKNVPLSESVEKIPQKFGATQLFGSPVIVGAMRQD